MKRDFIQYLAGAAAGVLLAGTAASRGGPGAGAGAAAAATFYVDWF